MPQEESGIGEDVAVTRKAPEVVAPAPQKKGQDPLRDPLTDPLAASQTKPNTEAPQAHEDTPPAQKARSAEGTAAGKASYKALLGDALGDKLYGAIAPNLTLDSLSKVAAQGVDGALKGLAGQLGSLKGDIDPKAVSAFATALGKAYGPAGADWMKGESGQKLAKSMGDWVDTNPEWIVGIALMAAAACIVADMQIPEIKQKMGLGGGFEAELGAKLGSLRNIALQEIQATVRYQAEGIKASLGVKNDDKGTSVDASATIGGKEANVEANAVMTEHGLEVVGLKGLKRTAAGDLTGGVEKAKDKEPVIKVGFTRQEGENTTVTNSAKYDSANSTLSTGSEVAYEKDGNKAKASTSMGPGGAQTAGIDLSTKLGNGFSAGFGGTGTRDAAGTETGALKGNLNYDSEHLKANVNAEASLGANTAYKVGGAVAYQDHLNKAQLGYQYDSARQQHDMSAMGQVGLGDSAALRGAVHHTENPQGNATEISAHAAKFVNKDLALFGGGSYELNSKGKSNFVPEVGAQIKGVPVKVGFDPSDRSWRVGVTIPF